MNNEEFVNTIYYASTLRPLIGVDVGGTKTRVDIMRNGITDSWTAPSDSWRSNSDDVLEDDMHRLGEIIVSRLGRLTDWPQACMRMPVICVGLHGGDFPEQLLLAHSLLTDCCPGTVMVVNDAELLGPAIGMYESINMVVGTGSNITGQTSDHAMLRTGGYGFGWLLSDFGSAPSLARESVREFLLDATIHGEDVAMRDALWSLLAERLDIRAVTELPLAIGAHISETEWGALAPLVFTAIDNGSHVARATLDFAVDVLGGSVELLIAKGAVGNAVVAAGGVITHQPMMQQLLRKRLMQVRARSLTLDILDRPPIDGALALAARKCLELAN